MLHYFTSLFGANTCSEQLFWLMPLLHHGDSYCTVLFLFFPSTQGNVHVEFLKVHSIQGKSLYISIGFHVVLCDFVCPIQTSPCYYIDTWQNVLLKSTSCWKWVRFSLCVSGVGDDGDTWREDGKEWNWDSSAHSYFSMIIMMWCATLKITATEGKPLPFPFQE